MDKLNDQLQQQLKFFDHRVTEWADVVRNLTKIQDTLSQFPPNSQISCLTELTQRLGQCLNPDLEQGIHIKSLDVYNQLFRIFSSNISKFLDDLFIPLLPIFQHASIQVKQRFLTVLDQLLKCDVPTNYTAPIVASLLSARIAEGDEIQQKVDQFYQILETRDPAYKTKLLEIAVYQKAARQNALKKLRGRKDLKIEDDFSFLQQVLVNGDENDIRIVLDIIFDQKCRANDALSNSIIQQLILLLNRDQSIVRRIHEWIYVGEVEDWASQLVFCIDELIEKGQNEEQLISCLLAEVQCNDDFLDIFVYTMYNMLCHLLKQGQLSLAFTPCKKLVSYFCQEQLIFSFIIRQLCTVLLSGRTNIDAKYTLTRVPLLGDECDDLYQIFFFLCQNVSVTKDQIIQEANVADDSVDVFGERVFNMNSKAIYVKNELLFILTQREINNIDGINAPLVQELVQLLWSQVDKQYCTILFDDNNMGYNCIIRKQKESLLQQFCQLIHDNTTLLQNQSYIEQLKNILMISENDFTSSQWFLDIVHESCQIPLNINFQDQKLVMQSYEFHVSQAKLSLSLLLALLQQNVLCCKYIVLFFEQNQFIVDKLVSQLFEQINQQDTLSESFLCQLSVLQSTQLFDQQLESYLASQIISSQDKLIIVQKFLILWQHGAEHYQENKLFQQILMLHIEMIQREDIQENVKNVIESFIKSCFNMDKWSLSLLDTIFDIIEQGPKLKQSEDNILFLARRTEDTVICDIDRCQYVMKLLCLLIQIGQETFITELFQLKPSKLIIQLVRNDLLYGQDNNQSYLDYIIDFSIIFLVVQDQLNPLLLRYSSDFIEQLLQIMKQNMSKSKILLQAVNNIQDKLSNIIIKSLVNKPQNRYIQQITSAILDVSSSMLTVASEQQYETGVSQEQIYIKLPAFISSFLKQRCLQKFLSSLQSVDLNMIQFLQNCIDVLGILPNDLSLSDVNQYCSEYVQFSVEKKTIDDIQGNIVKNIPDNISNCKLCDKLDAQLQRKYDEYQKKMRQFQQNYYCLDSMIPAPICQFPAVFISCQVINQLLQLFQSKSIQQISLSQALALTNLIYIASIQIFIGYQRYEGLTLKISQRASDYAKGKPSYCQNYMQTQKLESNMLNDLSMSFMIPYVLSLLNFIILNTDINDLSIGLRIKQNIDQTVAIIQNYSGYFYLLSLQEIYTDYNLSSYPLILSSSKNSLEVENLIKQSSIILNNYDKIGQQCEFIGNSFSQCIFMCSSSFTTVQLMVNYYSKLNVYSLLDLLIYKLMQCYQSFKNDQARNTFTQITNILYSQSSNFDAEKELHYTEPSYGKQLNIISLCKLLQMLCFTLQNQYLQQQFQKSDFSVIQSIIQNVEVQSFKALYLILQQNSPFDVPKPFISYPNSISPTFTSIKYISGSLFNQLIYLLQQFGHFSEIPQLQILPVTDCYKSAFPVHLSHLGDSFSFVDQNKTSINQRLESPAQLFAPVIPMLLQFLYDQPQLKSFTVKSLNLFMQFQEKRISVQCLAAPVLSFIQEQNLLMQDITVISQFRPYLTVAFQQFSSLDNASSSLLQNIRFKNEKAAKLLAEAFSASLYHYNDIIQVFQKYSSLIRKIDQEAVFDMKCLLLAISAIVYQADQKELQQIWTGVVQALAAMQKRNIQGVAEANYVLSQKYQENSVYVRFMQVNEVDFIPWFDQKISEFWKEIQ